MENETKKKSEYNEKKNTYTQKYIHENYKQLSIRLPIVGDITRDTIAEAAKKKGYSVNAYILEAVDRQKRFDENGENDLDEKVILNLTNWLKSKGHSDDEIIDCFRCLSSENELKE